MGIIDNDALTSLMGLDNIESNSIEDLIIYGNGCLFTCEVQSICDYLASPNGTVNIHDNAIGCNSQQEVEEECLRHCLPEGITFTTQAQIDSFAVNYPGCTEIDGDVIIGRSNPTTDISNLNGLNV